MKQKFGDLKMLTELDAIKIYEFKLSWMLNPSSPTPMRSLRGQSGPVAKLFGVSPRTVRDIWNRNTWSFASKGLWSREPASSAKFDDTAETSISNQVFPIICLSSYKNSTRYDFTSCCRITTKPGNILAGPRDLATRSRGFEGSDLSGH